MEIPAIVLIIVIAFWLQGLLYRKFYMTGLDYSCSFSQEEAVEGDDIYFTEVVYNRKLLPLLWLKVDIHTSRWLDFAEVHSTVAQDNRHVTSTFFLKGYQKTTRQWKLKCLKRGVFHIDNVTLTGGDLLGGKLISRAQRIGKCLLVVPRPLNLDQLLVPANHLQGITPVRRWILEDPFILAGAREYLPGDSMKKIHWSATAREGHLMVRRNEFTTETSLVILINIQSGEFEQRRTVFRDRVELAVKVAATLLDKALREGVPVRLGTNALVEDPALEEELRDSGAGPDGYLSREASGAAHGWELLRRLAMLRLQSTMDFDKYLMEVGREIDHADVIIVTSYGSDGIQKGVQEMKAKGNRIKVVLTNGDDLHRNWPPDLEISTVREGGEQYA